jgi:hypothetical protein
VSECRIISLLYRGWQSDAGGWKTLILLIGAGAAITLIALS